MFENMQNHNYADWELTQLLPTTNLYSDTDEWVEIENEDGIFYILESQIEDEDCCGSTIRDAWTWEDIRLYLLDKGFEIEIRRNNNQYTFKINCLKNNKIIDVVEYGYYSFEYELLRKTAIIECLNLINNDKKR
jgi:hypothetical protein